MECVASRASRGAPGTTGPRAETSRRNCAPTTASSERNGDGLASHRDETTTAAHAAYRKGGRCHGGAPSARRTRAGPLLFRVAGGWKSGAGSREIFGPAIVGASWPDGWMAYVSGQAAGQSPWRGVARRGGFTLAAVCRAHGAGRYFSVCRSDLLLPMELLEREDVVFVPSDHRVDGPPLHGVRVAACWGRRMLLFPRNLVHDHHSARVRLDLGVKQQTCLKMIQYPSFDLSDCQVKRENNSETVCLILPPYWYY